MIAHSHHLGDDRLTCPLNPENFGQFFKIVGRCLADGEHRITEPSHTQGTELLVEELNSELACQQRDILDDGQANPPLFVLGELNDGWEERLREKVDTNDYLKLVVSRQCV